MARRADDGRRGERGAVMVLVALAAAALILFAALTVDVGFIWSARTQSQNAADSAALAAAATMIDPAGPSVTLGPSREAAKEYAGDNSTVANPSVELDDADIVYGNWDLDTRTFDSSVDLTDPNRVTAVQVTVRMDGSDNGNAQAPAFLSRLAGKNGFDVTNRAIGYLGFEGSFAPGEFELPVAIDSCDLVSDADGCGDDFCERAAAPVNPCPLPEHAGGGEATCLQFHSTPEQNACWTEYSGDRRDVSANGLRDIVENGSPEEKEAGDEVYVDNGDKADVQREIKDKFEGTGDYEAKSGSCKRCNGPGPAGVDRYPTFLAPPISDSWVVKIPVLECQTENKCARRSRQAIVGGVCFEIREVTGPPDLVIKGRFLCPTSSDPEERALWQEYCADSGDDPPDAPGGCNFGFRADRVVLVQ